MKEYVKKFDGFLNESNNHMGGDISILKDADIEIGTFVTDVHNFKEGRFFCLLDNGDGMWRGDYKYTGKKGDTHTFIEDFNNGTTITFTNSELQDTIDDKLWATQH